MCGDHLAAVQLHVAGHKHLGRGTGAAAPTSEPVRGALWPIKVENVDLPGKEDAPVELGSVCAKAKELFANIERYMMAPDGEERVARSDIRAYSDPALQKRGVMLDLAVRLWCSNMLREVHAVRMEVDILSVVKKVTDREPRLRLIFDLRVVNLLFRSPPYVALSGPPVWLAWTSRKSRT